MSCDIVEIHFSVSFVFKMIAESIGTDKRHGRGERHVCQRRIFKSVVADALHALSDHCFFKGRTAIESQCADRCNAIGDPDAFKGSAVIERIGSNLCQRSRKHCLCQVLTASECVFTDGFDPVGNADDSDLGVVYKRSCTDRRNGFSVDL